MDIGSALRLGKKKEETHEDREIALERAQELHSESIVVDAHLSTLFDVFHNIRPFHEESEDGHADLVRLRAGGVSGAVMSAFLNERLIPLKGVKAGLEYIDAFQGLRQVPGVKICLNTQDLASAKEEGLLGVFLSFEGGEFLDGSISALRMYHRLGLRFLGLTWNERNLLADGAAFSMSRGGLTHFGLEVVRECGRLGIVVDAAHLSEAGFWDLVEESEEPFIVSHANCHALYAHPRNLTDDQLAALRDNGGVVGISFNPSYMADDDKEVTVSTVADHIVHAIEVAGEDHVAIGSDYDSFSEPGPSGLEHAGCLHSLTLELLKREMSGRTISAVLGGNLLRVMRAILG